MEAVETVEAESTFQATVTSPAIEYRQPCREPGIPQGRRDGRFTAHATIDHSVID